MTAAARREALAGAGGHCSQCRRPFEALLFAGAEGEWRDGETWRDWRGRPCAPPAEWWSRRCDACVTKDGRVLCRSCCSRTGGRPKKLGPKAARVRTRPRDVSQGTLPLAW